VVLVLSEIHLGSCNVASSRDLSPRLDDYLEVDIADHSGESTQTVTGGKADLCELTRKTVAGLPMLALMVGYTILSLWIIAQPIVADPGAASGALR
jgi:hypothetical protein